MLKNWTFSYTVCGADELFLDPGTYELEVWGASGGAYSTIPRGNGGYARGIITLRERTKVYVHVGSQGSDSSCGSGTQGCNGGGYGYGRSGGGATDIRLINDSLYSRVIVAGGGGGTGDQSSDNGGHGGGLNGGNGGCYSDSFLYNNCYAGKGGGQSKDTTACANGRENKCPRGTFGYGGNATGSYTGAGGGGWFGGSASNEECGGGGGSGYVFTESSSRVSGYLLGEEFYLTNTSSLDGSQSFPTPDKRGSETGHIGNGFAIINALEYFYPPPLNAIPPILDFSFTRNDEFVVNDEFGKFAFNESGVYTSNVKPGRFFINANGSSCGQSILAEYQTRKNQIMNIKISESIRISVNDEVILQAPGFGNEIGTTISSKLFVFYNYTMHEYHCYGSGPSKLTISYYSFNQPTCQRKVSHLYYNSRQAVHL
jgi:hypothetical protein